MANELRKTPIDGPTGRAPETGDDAYMVFTNGTQVGQQVPLNAESTTLGRGQSCDFQVKGRGVSRRHCRIGRDSAGHYLEDLGSTNGTLVNEVAVECVVLADGDLITLGDAVLEFVSPRVVASKRILVIDDDLQYSRLTKSLLKQWGFKVLTAATLGAGRELLLEEKPDLLIIDSFLPDGTGLELLEQHQGDLEETAVVMITGVGVDDVRVAAEAIRLGAVEFLTKPFSPDHLEATIERCLRGLEGRLETLQGLRIRERLPGRLLDLLEGERRNLSMELHDEIGQTLTRLKMEAELLAGSSWTREALDNRLQSLVTGLSAALEQVRFISWGLHPASLETMGLDHSLRLLGAELSQASAVQIHTYLSGFDQRLDRGLELAVYRIVQEALTNILRHAKATSAYVDVIRSGQSISITVEDDGVGFDTHAGGVDSIGTHGIGLLTIRERAERLGGQTEIASSPGKGTCLSVEIPIAPEEASQR